ncbi:replicative DNA helicase [Acaricomes phytoseiuli]|uniref:replicative DNA helicase n=1 Tax=Acaricomes phytoseiuli TaxID=291968 RepID=UPI002223A445|nr:replicative DNA helicase [Acaricomes phytoseiuli]MCW1249643.1 replicative DNA helicase [Acaricomes phytoseiuli]
MTISTGVVSMAEVPELYNLDAERSVLGALMLDERMVDEVTDIVTGRDFYQPRHELIFDTITGMSRERQSVDAVTVADALGSELHEHGGPAYLHELIQSVPTAVNAGYYALIVAEVAVKRRLRLAGAHIQELATRDAEAASLVEDARKLVDQISTGSSRERTLFLGETVGDALHAMRQSPQYVGTPWEDVNSLIGGVAPGQLVVVAARPSVGKSLVALMMALNLTRRGSVAFASLEMSQDEVWARIISSDLRIALDRILNRRLVRSDWERIEEARPRWATVPLAIRDNPSLTVTDIRKFARSTHRRHPLAGIVVDYLQLMSPARGDKRPRHEFVADVSRQLKVLAKEMQVPVIALSQLNRASEQRTDKQPQLSDLRESGAIEQDADIVMLLHRDLLDEATQTDLKVLVAKNRNGPTGLAKLTFYGHFSMALDPGMLPRSEAAYKRLSLGRTA